MHPQPGLHVVYNSITYQLTSLKAAEFSCDCSTPKLVSRKHQGVVNAIEYVAPQTTTSNADNLNIQELGEDLEASKLTNHRLTWV